MFKRDLKINFFIIEEIISEIRKYINALDKIKKAVSNTINLLGENKSEAFNELEKMHIKFKKEIKTCYEELNDLKEILTSYSNEMQGIIKPLNKSKMMRVDRNDIYWNLKDIEKAVMNLSSISLRTHCDNINLFDSIGIGKSEEEKNRQKNNYKKIEHILNSVIPRYEKKFSVKVDGLNKIYKNKVIKYENKDDEFSKKAGKLYDKYTGFFEGIMSNLSSFEQTLDGILTGFEDGIKDTVLGILELAWGFVRYEAAAIVLDVTEPFNVKPKWADEAYNGTNEMIESILKDPYLIIEGLSQQISDSVDEEGIGYGTGYIAGSIFGAKGIEKVSKLVKMKLLNKSGGVVDDVDDLSKVDDIGSTASKLDEIDNFKVIDGKVDGKIPLDDYKEIRSNSIKNPKSDEITLGKYDPSIDKYGKPDYSIPASSAYTVKAGKTTYFDLGTDWGKIKTKYNLTDDEMFKYFNVPALDDAMKAGKSIRFSHNPEDFINCALEDEWKYLQNKGYTDLEQRGDFWYATKE